MEMERKRMVYFLFALLSIMATETKGDNEVPVMVDLRSPELGNLILDHEMDSAAANEEPVQVSSVKLNNGLGNFWGARNYKKPLTNWRDHYIRSSRMSQHNDDSVNSVGQDVERPMYLEEDSVFGPILVSLEPVALRQNSAQRNHYLRTKKKSASASPTTTTATKAKSNNIQSHYLRSSRSTENISGRKRQTNERDHFLRTVRSSSSAGGKDNSNNNNNNNESSNNNSADRKARDHYLRTVRSSIDDDDVDWMSRETIENQLSAFNSCMKAALENII